jgi:putative phosphonate catabolism associated alcohol dehydrogenase
MEQDPKVGLKLVMTKLSTSHAAVFYKPNQPMKWEEFPVPPLVGSEVLVRIRCATICGSDLHTYHGRRSAPAPSVLGHEMVGEIVAIGPNGAIDFSGQAICLGDRITWSMVWSCGSCFYCSQGLRPKCESLLKFGHEKIAPGKQLFGGFGEHCLLPEGTAIFRTPANVSDLVASPSNCATATVAAVFRHAGKVEGHTVVIIGAGMLGLTACAMAVAQGANQVIAVETKPGRAALATEFGADVVLGGMESIDAMRDQVLDLTNGRGAEFVFEFSGSPDAMERGWQLLGFGGRFILAGATFPARPFAIPGEQVVRRMLHIQGVYNYNPEDLAAALTFLSTQGARFPFERLVGRVFPMRQIEQALEFAERTSPPRVALIP